MITKRIAALALGAALATSALVAPQASANNPHRDRCDRGYEWVQVKGKNGYCKKKDNDWRHAQHKVQPHRQDQNRHKGNWNNRGHDNRGHDNRGHGQHHSPNLNQNLNQNQQAFSFSLSS